ncbi:MAG: sigma 54-interacting transcriptional regulator [Hyphomicrobiales bacterium]
MEAIFERLNKEIEEKDRQEFQNSNTMVNKSFPEINDRQYNKPKAEQLINAAAPFMKYLFNSINSKNFYLILTNEKAETLKIIGNNDHLRAHSISKFLPDSVMDESHIGPNAIWKAIKENKPIQFCLSFLEECSGRPLTCSAVPIHNIEGKVIGALNISGFSKDVHQHTLGMVVAAARAIENRLENKYITQQLFESNQFAWSMMNNLSYGMFAIDLNDKIHWVNDTACRTLNIRRSYLIDHSINEIYAHFDKARNAILNNTTYADEESCFDLDHLNEKFLFNAHPIRTKDGEHHGVLLSFRPYSKMISLLSKFSVGRAWFSFENIIGSSNSLRNVVKKAKVVANSPSTILITGPSGTGKEVFAQAIHNASDRRNNGFVAINCGAISPTLIESELFGYEDGAFTGARKGGHPGKFELADNGTIFLDEVGDMPLDMQVKLLRAIQEGIVCRVGSNKSISINVRIIAATNKNLEEEIKKGKFRLDLFYRLSVIPMRIPSLMERAEDIPELTRHFLKMKAHKLQKPIPTLSEEIMEKMKAYNWPGNIRELENFIEKVVNLDGTIDTDIEHTQQWEIFHDEKPASDNQISVEDNTKLVSLEELEKKAIIRTYKALDGNMTQVAKTLGISRNTLYLKIKKYNLNL